MGKGSLPPGFRFHPTDVELVMYYLKRKVMDRKFFDAIAEVDIYKCAPWDLPAKSSLRTGDLEWYFLCPREKKYGSGARVNRATEFGFWKITGKDRHVYYNKETVGKINTLVFHRGKAPKGERTDWVIHEYRIEAKDLANQGVVQDSYVLCKVFQKDGRGPRNGAQYGAPFKEEDWDDDEDVNCMGVVSEGVHSIPVPNLISPVAASSSCLLDAIPPVSNVPSPTPENNGVASEAATVFPEDDIDSMLAIFKEDSTPFPDENGENENLVHQPNEIIEVLPHVDGIDIYSGLGDLGNICRLSEGACDFSSSYNEYGYLNQSFLGDNTPFLELRDLDALLGNICRLSEGACDFSSSYNEYGYLNQSFLGDNTPFLELRDLDAPLDGPAEAGISEPIRTNELYSNQNCYNAGQSSVTVNPGSSQCPLTLLDDLMAEDL